MSDKLVTIWIVTGTLEVAEARAVLSGDTYFVYATSRGENCEFPASDEGKRFALSEFDAVKLANANRATWLATAEKEWAKERKATCDVARL